MIFFSSFVYHAGLYKNFYFVLMLLCAQVFGGNSTLENFTFQGDKFKSINQVDSQIPKSPHKCCGRDEWLNHSNSDAEYLCRKLPLNIRNMSLKSNRNRQLFKTDVILNVFCRTSKFVEMWTRSTSKNYSYHSTEETVFNLVTKTHFKVFCGDYINLHEFYSDSTNYENVTNFNNLENEAAGIILCNIWEPTFEEKISYFLSIYGLGLSNLFLAITFYLFATRLKFRRSIQGKCILCYIAALIFGYGSYAWSGLERKNDELTIYCLLAGFLCQYWLLAMFTWRTIICINLCFTIAAPTPEHSTFRKFMVYCLIGWGFPLAMSWATFKATQLDMGHDFNVNFDLGCWFQLWNDRPFWLQPEFIYFNSYVLLTLLINVCSFIYVTFILISNDCYWKRAEDSQRHEANENRFPKYLKLFLGMGLTWIVGSLSFSMYITNEVGQRFGILLDLLTMLQSILISIVFIHNTKAKATKMKRSSRSGNHK